MDLTDLTVIPMIILGIASSGFYLHQITGWNILLTSLLGVIPGYAVGVVVGLLLAAIIGTLLDFVTKIGNWLAK